MPHSGVFYSSKIHLFFITICLGCQPQNEIWPPLTFFESTPRTGNKTETHMQNQPNKEITSPIPPLSNNLSPHTPPPPHSRPSNPPPQPNRRFKCKTCFLSTPAQPRCPRSAVPWRNWLPASPAQYSSHPSKGRGYNTCHARREGRRSKLEGRSRLTSSLAQTDNTDCGSAES